jgi:hypothetical protein
MVTGHRGVIWSWPIHPLLLAAYPILFLFAANIREQVTITALYAPAALAVAGAVSVLVVLAALLRNWQRAGLTTTVLVVAFFAYGHVRNAFGEGFTNEGLLLLAWATISLAGVAASLRVRRLSTVTGALNVVGAVLVAVNLAPIAQFAIATANTGRTTVDPQQSVAGGDAQGQRDIYYLIFDRYASGRTLSEIYGFDNSGFLDELSSRGFYVAEESQANYLKTAHSLASSLNMDYLSAAELRARATGDDDWKPTYEMLLGSYEVEERLRAVGYTYIHIGSIFSATATNADADRVLRFSEQSEFESVLVDTTLLGALNGLAPDEQARDRRLPYRLNTIYQLNRLDEMADVRGPKFVFAHLLLPHPPWIFDRDGGYVSPELAATRGSRENYLEQLQYANKRILRLLDRLLAGDDASDPIIVLQADEGPLPARYAHDEDHFDWTSATTEELREKMGILNTYHLPGRADAGLYQSITPVNSFRVVFNAYFDANLPLLPDKSYIFTDQLHLYDFRDVTDRLRASVSSTR